jgi:hypothetical protein
MTLNELIERLEAIRREHGGDLIVMHHDDWDSFAVETIVYEPPYSENDGEYRLPEHVLIEGEDRHFNGETGTLSDYYRGPHSGRMLYFNAFMRDVPEPWRYRWCSAEVCACSGCTNHSGGAIAAGYNIEDWQEWLKTHPEPVPQHTRIEQSLEPRRLDPERLPK